MVTHDTELFLTQLSKSSPLLAIDFGLKKTGIAISDPNRIMAVPLTTIEAIGLKEQLQKLQSLINKHKPTGLVMGWPLNKDGTRTTLTHHIKRLAHCLCKTTQLPILLYDERFSSRAAYNLLKLSEISAKQRYYIEDQVAANIILTEILNWRN